VVRKPVDYAATAFFNVGYDLDDLRACLQDVIIERTKGVGLVVSSWAMQSQTGVQSVISHLHSNFDAFQNIM
nr:anthocyanidin 3-O-glucosyltransferase 5-like [Tanacetum cinerariifolium]